MLTDTRKRGMGGTESIFTVERTEYKTLILPWGGRLGVRRRKTGIESRERILTRKALLNRETAHVKEEHQASSVSPVGVRAEGTVPVQGDRTGRGAEAGACLACPAPKFNTLSRS